MFTRGFDCNKTKSNYNMSPSLPEQGDPEGTTVFIRGFDTNQSEEDVRSALQEAFAPCGSIVSIRLPSDREVWCVCVCLVGTYMLSAAGKGGWHTAHVRT